MNREKFGMKACEKPSNNNMKKQFTKLDLERILKDTRMESTGVSIRDIAEIIISVFEHSEVDALIRELTNDPKEIIEDHKLDNARDMMEELHSSNNGE